MTFQRTSARTILWLSAHPEPRSLNGSLRRDSLSYLRGLGYEVIESDLYAMGWDPVFRRPEPDEGYSVNAQRFFVSRDTRDAYRSGTQSEDVSDEQAKLARADALIVQFPLWWYGMPAMLKGWFDRVFVSGYAFGIDPQSGRRLRFEQGPFVGERALVVTTLGDRPHAIGPRGKSGELQELLFGLLHGTFAYTGMSVLSPWALPSADRIADYDAVFDSLRIRLPGLFTDDVIPYRPQFTGDYTEEWELAPHVRSGEHGLRIHTLVEPSAGQENCGA